MKDKIRIKGMSGFGFGICLREMCSACNKFLDELLTENRHKIIYKNTNGNWEDASYSRILNEFRDTFIECIKTITTEYKIEIPNKLREISCEIYAIQQKGPPSMAEILGKVFVDFLKGWTHYGFELCISFYEGL